jgi:hypothetical protein
MADKDYLQELHQTCARQDQDQNSPKRPNGSTKKISSVANATTFDEDIGKLPASSSDCPEALNVSLDLTDSWRRLGHARLELHCPPLTTHDEILNSSWRFPEGIADELESALGAKRTSRRGAGRQNPPWFSVARQIA